MVEVPYMEDRIGRQRQDLAQIWPRDGSVRSHGSLEHGNASCHGGLLRTVDASVGSVL